MAMRGLVEALREGDEDAVWAALADDAPEGSWRSGLWAVDRDEGLRLARRGGLATRVALSRHPDGRVREAAVRALEPGGGAVLLALLRRANDWVPAIARLAQERAIASFPRSDHADLTMALPLVHDLTRQRRADHAPLVAAFRREVAGRAGLAPRLRAAYRAGDLGLWTFRNLVGTREASEALASEGLSSRHPAVQWEAARIAARDPAAWPRLLAHPNPRIRRLGLDVAPEAAREEALTDTHAGVRNDARYLLGKRDYATFYRERLSEPGKLPWIARALLKPEDRKDLEGRLSPPAGAVSGLGETGTRDDADDLVPLLKHPRVDVRARAVEAIHRLRGDAAEPLLLTMLLDPSPRVQRSAVEALVRSNLGFDPDGLLRWPLKPSSRNRLLDRSPRWAALLAVLRRAESLDGADEWLARWATKASDGRLPPRPEELAEARALLQTTVLSPVTQTALRGALAGWRL